MFKPIDEEAFAPNNPRDHVGPFGSKTFRAGVLSGEACIREVAAYLIDEAGFSGVPPTTMVEASHGSFRTFKFSNFKVVEKNKDYIDMISSIIAPENQVQNHEAESSALTDIKSQGILNAIQDTKFFKIGSLQSFIKSEGPIENFSSSLFSPDEIHKIAVLDLRLMNLDRNECNILVSQSYSSDSSSYSTLSNQKVKRKLIPIDHGLSIPDTLEVQSWDICWLGYSQAEEPLSAKTLEYIKKIDVMKDI